MQSALTFQFDRAVNEYARWQAVPAVERSDASAWWWSTALAAIDEKQLCPWSGVPSSVMPTIRLTLRARKFL
jgi:hypothetical protein